MTVWNNLNASRRPLGASLIGQMPRADKDADELQLPDRRDPPRDDAFEPAAAIALKRKLPVPPNRK